jgi:transposase InsO family protein
VAQKAVSMQTKLAAVLAREVVQGRGTVPVTVICAQLGISRQTYYVYRRRFQAEGVAGLMPRSRRPHSSPRRLGVGVEDAVVAAHKHLEEHGWDCGAISIHARLLAGAGGEAVPSLRSIHRILHRRGLVPPAPQKRTRASYRRFEFPASDDCWQIDAFEHALADGGTVVVFEVLDDHSRFLVANLAWPGEDGAGAWTAVSTAIAAYGRPRMLLSDNSLAFSGARRQRQVQFETNLRALGIKPITSRPYRPTTCGKNERHHQTCQRWLRRQPPAATIAALQTQLETYRAAYNQHRPHQGIGMTTPTARHEAGRRQPHPDAGDARDADTPPTVSSEHTVTARGQIRLTGTGIGLGSQWAGSRVTAFRTGKHLLVFHRDELVRELTIDHTRSFQPTGQPRGGTRRTRIADTIT